MDFTQLSWALAGDVFLRLGAATVLGAMLTFHPLRLRRQILDDDIDWDILRTQIIISVAAALMVIVVGDSMARAFGLVGIGSFVRFRTVMKNPRDAAVLFVLIGVGMGCGLKFYALSAVVAVFVFLLLFLVELGPRPDRSKKKKKAEEEEPPLPDEGPL